MINLIRIVALLARFQGYQSCDVDDWGLDNVRDLGAESVGISCDSGERDDRNDLFLLVGPDFIGDVLQ